MVNESYRYFVFDDMAMDRAMKLYIAIVSDFMRTACLSKLWRHSDTAEDDTHAEDDIKSFTGVQQSMLGREEVMRTLHAWPLIFRCLRSTKRCLMVAGVH